MSEKESVSLEAALGTVQKMAALCETAQEAARHATESPAALAEMRSLILESVQSLGSRAAESLGAADAFSSLAESYRRELAGLNGRGLEQAVRSWRTAFLKQAGTQLFNQLKETLQISQEAALTASQLAEGGLFPDAKSTGVFLLEIAERCGMTAPELSAQLLLKAFTAAPDLLADSNLPYLKEYVYHPGQSAQHSFRRCPVCGGTGGAYRAACSCLINSFDPMFLPAKLWMKCPDCGNLYTYWFPEAFLALGKQPRLIAPQEGQVRVQAANSVLLRS